MGQTTPVCGFAQAAEGCVYAGLQGTKEIIMSHNNPLIEACDERDETRRWLMDICLELGVPRAAPDDHEKPPHEAWRGVYDRIMEHLRRRRALETRLERA